MATTRGQQWIYRGAMRSVNAVRVGVDIKSTMSYARWLPGTGTLADLPDTVRALAEKKPSAARPVPAPWPCPRRPGVGSAVTARPPTWSVASPWRSSASPKPPVGSAPRCTGTGPQGAGKSTGARMLLRVIEGMSRDLRRTGRRWPPPSSGSTRGSSAGSPPRPPAEGYGPSEVMLHRPDMVEALLRTDPTLEAWPPIPC
ncbi:hypothetical protein GCM10010222_26310 [Streptomyces tanashiensis]|nr:hypothetical protein GCM10010222_26310 [Streptomyces tanashiensis]